jgi:hypothetical protein
MRNEDYDRELLAFVTLFCVVFAAAVSVFDTSPSAARTTQSAARVEQPGPAPVRVIGTPFVPNTNPSVR